MKEDSKSKVQASIVFIAGMAGAFYGIPFAYGSLMNGRINHFDACRYPFDASPGEGKVMRHLYGPREFLRFLVTGGLDQCNPTSQGIGPYRGLAIVSIVLMLLTTFAGIGYIIKEGPIEALGENVLGTIFFFGIAVFALVALLVWAIFIAIFFMIAIVLGIGFSATRD